MGPSPEAIAVDVYATVRPLDFHVEVLTDKGEDMDLFEAIHTRRSIRKYRDREVPEELVHKILSAAMMAPSAGNEQPWQFILVTDPEKKKQIMTVHPYVAMIMNAPLGILICGDLSKEKYKGFWSQDCSAAMQNLLLAAHASGLGAVWTGIYPMADRVEKFENIFDLPDQIIPFGLAVIGWPGQNLTANDRFSPDRIHYNIWGEEWER